MGAICTATLVIRSSFEGSDGRADRKRWRERLGYARWFEIQCARKHEDSEFGADKKKG